ncbi:hypothetical protein [Bradyrhizobium sp. SZCCHNS3053]|uniref:hypothetical protein n=1 Tax=Bradyrhizobium sp. SZCCHNS3053 TaxID=3057322 RepID=UPI002916E877|nr:hypothetical protein [Bradyrhizobium sp. SZCCHNS3053]
MTLAALDELDCSAFRSAILYLPLPSVGSTNNPADICSDYLDASWVAEQLAALSEEATVRDESAAHRTLLKLQLAGVHADMRPALEDAVILFQGGEEDEDRYVNILDLVGSYADGLNNCAPRLPELIDTYFANLVNGGYSEMRSEAPEHYRAEIERFPERQLGFHKSALSHRLGAASYVSAESWVVPVAVDVDRFFEITEQAYRLNEFVTGTVFLVEGRSYARSAEHAVNFPMNHYFVARACATFAQRQDEDAWDYFAARSATFTQLRAQASSDSLGGIDDRRPGECMIHRSGTLVIFNDGLFRHLLYGSAPLSRVEIRRLHESLSEGMRSLADMSGLSQLLPEETQSYEWCVLTDEQFELLCYEIIAAHPRFDSSTIRKFGKSRSRDGGRDIEVRERTAQRGGPGRKWIFQCKLITNGSSLSASKVQDVGDMLDKYDVRGFGVMTSALIDAGLYDKLDAVCGKRDIAQLNFSRLEIEHQLRGSPDLRMLFARMRTIGN